MKEKSGLIWLLGFTGVFAVLAAHVFWGTWSPDVAPVMPDTATTYSTVYGDTFADWLNGFLSSGKVVPTDVLWSGLSIAPYWLQEFKFALGLFCAALGLAYFLRGRGLSRLASFGAGLLLAFCGYWCTLFSAGHGGWFVWMTYGVFAFGLADRAVRFGRLRHWLLLGLDVSWAGFQQPDLWLLFSTFTAIYVIWCCVRERKFPWKGALIALAAFALVGLPNFKDTVQNALKGRIEQVSRGENVTQKDGDEMAKRWEFVTNWSMPTEDTLEFFVPRVYGDKSCPFVLSINGRQGVKPYAGALGRPMNAKEGNYRQHSLYVGFVTCILALLGVVFACFQLKTSKPQNLKTLHSDLFFFLVAAILCWLFSMGRYCEPAYRIIFALPFGDLIRCPVKWHHLTELCLAVLAGYGIEALAARLGQLGRAGRFAPLIVGAVVLLGAFDLATEAHRFCAPVNVGPARRMNASMQMTILPRQQFQNPQVAAMVQAGRIVSIANYMGNPDYFLVGVLDRVKPRENGEISLWTVILGLLSIGTSLSVTIYSIIVATRPRNVV